MKKVGLTGGIGSGKSTVAKVFELLDVPVYYADDRAKRLMTESSAVKSSIIDLFGQEAYDGKVLNRKYLAEKVFADAKNVEAINNIVHPAVRRDFEEWATNGQSSPYVLQEAALLVDNGGYKNFDQLITVSASEKTRKARVLKRDPFRSDEQVNQIIKKQVDESKRIAAADFVILNENKDLIIHQVLNIHKKLIS